MALKILIAEDSTTNRLLFSITMTRLGHEVDIAANGQEAVDMFKDNFYDLVFLDLYMPVMTGIEAAYAIKRFNTRNVPIYAISGLPPDDMAQRFQDVGIRRCLLKPMDREKITEVVRESCLIEKAANSPDVDSELPAPRRLMVSYVHELRSRGDACAVFYREGDFTGLFREARTIQSIAEMLGLPDLEKLACEIESGCETRKVLNHQVDDMTMTCRLAADRIEKHLPPPRR